MGSDLREREGAAPRRAASVTVAVLVMTAAVLAVRGAEAATPLAAARQPAGDVGAFLYGRDCAGCHGPTGGGSPRGVPLTDSGEAGVHYALVSGRMPLAQHDDQPRRGPSPYSDEQIEALTDHVAGFGDGPALPEVDWRSADTGRGGTLYRLHCGACHSSTAIGGALAFDRQAPSLMPSEPSVIAAAMVAGPGAMPDFAPRGFTDDELASIVAYVRAMQTPVDRGGWPIFRAGRADEALVAWFLAIPALLLAAGWVARRAR